MMKSRNTRWTLLMVNCVLSINLIGFSVTSAAEPEHIRIAVDEWPPYQTRSAQYYGGAHRIITEAFALEGVAVEYGWFPWTRSLYYAKEGIWDGAALSQRTPEKERDFYFSEPVMTVQKVFFHLKTYDFDWQNYEDLRGIVIGIRRGFLYGQAFEEAKQAGELTIVEVDTEKQSFRMLLLGRIQLFAAELDAGSYLLTTEFPDQYELITHHSSPLQVVTYHVIFSKKVAHNERMRDRFNRGLQQLQESGKVKQYLREAMQGEYTIDRK